MVRKRKLIYAAFMVFFVMSLAYLSALCVSAREEMKPGLVIGWADWENDRPVFSDNLDDYDTEIMFRASYTDCMQIGWVDDAGNVTPIVLNDVDEDNENYNIFTLIPEGGGEEEFRITPHGEYEYDPETERFEFVLSGDGLFDLNIPKTGSFTLLYQGPETHGAAGDFCTVSIDAILPPVGIYSENAVRDEYLLNTEEIPYKIGTEFYILPYNTLDEFDRADVTNLICRTRGSFDMDLEPLDNGGFKATLQDGRGYDMDFQILFTVTYRHKEEGSSTWTVRDSNEEDRWIHLKALPRTGLAVCWPENIDNTPAFPEEEGRLRGWIDRRAGYMDWIGIAWIAEDGTVTPISLDNEYDFAVSGTGDYDFRLDVCTRWDEEAHEDVALGDGFFNLGFLQPGTYTLIYSGPEAEGADEDACSVTIDVTMPPVGLYKKNQVSSANLIWADAVDYTSGSEFYILPYTIENYGEKQEPLEISCQQKKGKKVSLAASGSGYKVTITDDMNDWFEIQTTFKLSYSHYDEESSSWVTHHIDDQDRWFNFRPMEKYGLVIGSIGWERNPDEQDRPLFETVDMKGCQEADVYDVPGFSIGWKDAEGEIRPIPVSDIDKFKAYDENGNEIKDWIWPHSYWPGETEENLQSDDGLFAIQFKKLGKFRIEYTGGDISNDVQNMTNSVNIHVLMPLVGLYSSKEATFENLLCPDFEARSILYTDNSKVFYINAKDEAVSKDYQIFTTLLPDEIEVHDVSQYEGDAWKSRISFEKLNDKCIKVTLLGDEDWLDVCVPFRIRRLEWDWDDNDWSFSDEFVRSTWINFSYKELTDISGASISGVSLSYGYSGKAYTPSFQVKVGGVTLTAGTDYTYKFENNINPGTATLTITGIGNYEGTRVKKFEIVECVSALQNGKTYQLIPKNNSKTAVCAFSGKMVKNTKVYITDRSDSEAMKFKAVKNGDGSWTFINAKSELVLAVQQNSSEAGKGLVLYDNTGKDAQHWKLSRKSDNSFAITNAVSGKDIAMSDASAVKGTTLSIAVPASSGLQRFYIAETTAVSAPFDGTYAVKASKNQKFALNIASSSKTDGANVNLYTYSNTAAKKFKIMYSGGGTYRLVNVNSGLCLTVAGNSRKDGANVVQSAWAAQNGQRWRITKYTDGTVTLTNVNGTVLHLNANKTANGTNVLAKNASTSTAQKWYLVK